MDAERGSEEYHYISSHLVQSEGGVSDPFPMMFQLYLPGPSHDHCPQFVNAEMNREAERGVFRLRSLVGVGVGVGVGAEIFFRYDAGNESCLQLGIQM
jgi:hypothetical protein